MREMFDEVVVRAELGCKVLAGQLVVGRFGRDRADSVVAISQTLDKLIVHDPSILSNALDISNAGLATTTAANCGTALNGLPMAANSPTSQLASVYYVSVRDVIKTVSVKSFATSSPPPATQASSSSMTRLGNVEETSAEPSNLGESSSSLPEQKQQQQQNSSSSWTAASAHNNLNSSRSAPEDLLLIGCSNSVLVYDAFNQRSLLSLNTPNQVNTISSGSSSCAPPSSQQAFATDLQWRQPATTVFGGPQRLYTVRFEPEQFGTEGRNVHAEISSERSTGDTIICLAQGRLGPMELVLTGSLEQKIRAYLLDSFEQNIQACRLTIDEGAKINCLCPVNTQVASASDAASQNQQAHNKTASALLPSVVGDHFAQVAPPEWAQAEQMNYFAFGLESSFIGVYRLFLQHRNLHSLPTGVGLDAAAATDSDELALSAERLWRHKCKQTPTAMLMYDINGDGFDELIVGFKSGRLEARAPFTGQLLAVSRCFRSSSERLAGLVALDYQRVGLGRQVLVACSTSGSLVGFRPRFCQPRIPLQGYSLGYGTDQAKHADSLLDWPYLQPNAAGLLYNPTLAHHANSKSQTATLLKTIEEEQLQQQRLDVFSMKHSSATADGGASSSPAADALADLHIESKADDTKPAKCDARQSLELLQRINSLQAEQMELERRACHIYHLNVSQASKFYPSDVSISHKWSSDSAALCLRLSIFVSTSVEYVNLVELEDESRNFLSNGHLLVDPAQSACAEECDHKQQAPHLQSAGADSSDQIASQPPKSHVIVVPLRSLRNQESRLELKVFCESFRKTSDSSRPIRVARVYRKQIDVPKFAMFTASLADTTAVVASARNSRQATAAEGSNNELIRVAFRLKDSSKVQLLKWLHESFLYFQFKSSLDQASVGVQAKDSINSSTESGNGGGRHQATRRQRQDSARKMMIMDDKSEKFELNLMDIRHTLAKMAKHEAATDSVEKSLTANQGGGCQVLSKFCSRLRIVYSPDGILTVECESTDLIVDLARSLALIDHWQLDSFSAAAADKQLAAAATDGRFNDLVVSAEVGPILEQLETLTGNAKQLEESEKRIQTELYESADYTRNLLQQLGIASDLNEFTTAKELLGELFMMLNGAQNAARAHCLNNRSRGELLNQISELKQKVSFLTGQSEGYCREPIGGT